MSLYTSTIYNRIAVRYHKYGTKRQVLVFFAGYCIQHYIEREILNGQAGTITDMSEISPFIGKTANAVWRSHPYFKLGSTPEMTDFCEFTHNDLSLWIASRFQFLKEYTANNHVSSRLIKMVMEAANNGE